MIGLLFALQTSIFDMPKPSEEMTSRLGEYSACVESEVLALEPSGEPYSEVFKGAKTACAKQWLLAVRATSDHLSTLPPSSTGRTSDQIAVEFMDGHDESLESTLRLKVLRLKAARND